MKDTDILIETIALTTPLLSTSATDVAVSSSTTIQFVYDVIKCYPTTSVVVVLSVGIIIYFLTAAPAADVILPGPVEQGPVEQIPVTQEALTQLPLGEASPFVNIAGFCDEQLDSERYEWEQAERCKLERIEWERSQQERYARERYERDNVGPLPEKAQEAPTPLPRSEANSIGRIEKAQEAPTLVLPRGGANSIGRIEKAQEVPILVLPRGEASSSAIVVDATVAAEAAQLVVVEGIPFLGIGFCFLAILVGAAVGFLRPLI